MPCRGHERVELYLYSPCGPYGLYRASVSVQGWPLPFYLPFPPQISMYVSTTTFFSPLFQNTFYCWCNSLNGCHNSHTVFPEQSIVQKCYVLCRGFWQWNSKRNYKVAFLQQCCWRFKYSGMCCFVGEYFLTLQRTIVSKDKDTLILSKHQEVLTKENNVTSQRTWVYHYDYMASRLCPLSRIQKRTQFWELDLFPSSAKGLGGTYSFGSDSSTCAYSLNILCQVSAFRYVMLDHTLCARVDRKYW